MHQRQTTKSTPAQQAAARRDAQPLAPASEHARWMELQRGIGNQSVSRVLQRRTAEGAGKKTQSAGASVERVLASAGRPLDLALRDEMEQRFGHDFSQVRVHSDQAADQSAREVDAHAYTVGQDIVFAASQFAPGTLDGRRLIAHELAHVVQQRAGRVLPPEGKDSPVVVDKRLEEEAEQHGELAAKGVPVPVVGRATQGPADLGGAVQCQGGTHDPDVVHRGPPGPRGERGPKGEKGEKGETGDPGLDAVYLTQFDATYNKAVSAWSYLTQKQVLAIDSIYTEAKKPQEPGLAEEILISLAIGILAAGGVTIGGLIAGRIEKQVEAAFLRRLTFDTRMGGTGRWVLALGNNRRTLVSKDFAESMQHNAERYAAMVGEATTDFFKDGIPEFAGGKIKKLLDSKKLPIDAFFEGAKDSVIDAGKKASDKAEDERAGMLQNSDDPLASAEGLVKTMEGLYDDAMEAQKELTLRGWLLYQARARLKTTAGSKATGVYGGKYGLRDPDAATEDPKKPSQGFEPVTNLANLPKQASVLPEIPGVIIVDMYTTPGKSPGFQIVRAILPGLSGAMLEMLETKTVMQTRLPLVIRVIASHFSGKGYYSPGGPHTPDEDQYTIRVTEDGNVGPFAFSRAHQKNLAEYVGASPTSPDEYAFPDVQRGADAIALAILMTSVKDLKIKPDKE